MTIDAILDSNILTNKAMLVTLNISQWTARKMDRKVSGDVAKQNNIDPKLGSYYKSLIDKDALSPISQNANAARDLHYRMTLPWADNGQRILSNAAFMDYMSEMKSHQRTHESLVATLAAMYPDLRNEARSKLGALFNDAEYPTVDQLVMKFGFAVNVMPMPSSQDFRCSLDPAVVDSIRNDIEGRVTGAAKVAIQDAFDRANEVLNRYLERLADDDKVFRNSMVEQAIEVADMLPKLNFVDDPNLNALAKEIKDRITKYRPDELRNSPTARREAHTAAKEIKQDFAEFFGLA